MLLSHSAIRNQQLADLHRSPELARAEGGFSSCDLFLQVDSSLLPHYIGPFEIERINPSAVSLTLPGSMYPY